jgi:hypothetical protein
MDTEVIVSFVALAGSITSVVVTFLIGTRRLQSEEQRWYSDYLLRKKHETLVTLYESLLDRIDSVLLGSQKIFLSLVAIEDPNDMEIALEKAKFSTDRWISYVVTEQNECAHLIRKASIYLKRDDVKVVSELVRATTEYAKRFSDKISQAWEEGSSSQPIFLVDEVEQSMTTASDAVSGQLHDVTDMLRSYLSPDSVNKK